MLGRLGLTEPRGAVGTPRPAYESGAPEMDPELAKFRKRADGRPRGVQLGDATAQPGTGARLWAPYPYDRAYQAAGPASGYPARRNPDDDECFAERLPASCS